MALVKSFHLCLPPFAYFIYVSDSLLKPSVLAVGSISSIIINQDGSSLSTSPLLYVHPKLGILWGLEGLHTHPEAVGKLCEGGRTLEHLLPSHPPIPAAHGGVGLSCTTEERILWSCRSLPFSAPSSFAPCDFLHNSPLNPVFSHAVWLLSVVSSTVTFLRGTGLALRGCSWAKVGPKLWEIAGC